MAESSEAYHVPQQCRRDKLRVITPSSSSSPLLAQSSLSINPSSIQNIINTTTIATTNLAFTGHGLSLSESYRHRYHNLAFQLNPLRRDSITIGELAHGGDFSIPKPNGESRSSVPLGPFTGYASILKRSRFLKPAQQILEDLCGVEGGKYDERKCMSSYLVEPTLESLREAGIVKNPIITCSGRIEHRFKNLRLASMLEEVYKKYKLYCQQMHSVVVSFEAVSGLGNAAPYISFAFKAMSKHFRCLKNAILDQIQFTGKASSNVSVGQDSNPRFWTANGDLHGPKSVWNSTLTRHPVWRSQRGLPDHAVAVLRTWLFEHFLHPYPTDLDKQMLAQQTGLSKTQVSNWFINARVRLWRPMVEEMHMLEAHQAQTPAEAENQNANLLADHQPLANPLPSEKLLQTIATPKTQDTQFKRSRNELPHMPNRIEDPMKLSWSNLSSNHHSFCGSRAGGSSTGISLALGLNQNNGMHISQPFPMDFACQFGLERSTEMYMGNGLNAQNQHLEFM